MAKTEFVKAKKGKQTTTFVKSAFEKVWKDKGWEKVEEGQTKGSTTPQTNTRTQIETPKE